MKRLIAIDIDDVLADETNSAIRFFNEHFGLKLTRQDYDVDGPYWGYWESIWKVSDEKAAEMAAAYVHSDARAEHTVLPHAIEVVSDLKRKYDLIIITSREDVLVDLTEQWLHVHFPNTFDHVAFTAVWQPKPGATKAEIANHLGAGYLIDDNAEHCNVAAEAGLQALLFGEYGWNRKAELRDSVVRVKNWLAVRDYFDAAR